MRSILKYSSLIFLISFVVISFASNGKADIYANPKIKIDAGELRLSHVFNGISPLEDRIIGKAPSFGKLLRFDAGSLDYIAQKYKLDVDSNVLANASAVVSRASKLIEQRALKDQIKNLVLESMPSTDSVDITFTGNANIAIPRLRKSAPLISEISINKERATFNAFVVSIEDEQGPRISGEITGSFTSLRDVPQIARALSRGQAIQARDVIMASVPVSRVTANAITDMDQIIGKAAKRNLPIGRIVQVHDVTPEILIKRGEVVSVSYKKGNLILETRMEALEKGAKGDLINLRNPHSKRVIEGQVASAGRVIAFH